MKNVLLGCPSFGNVTAASASAFWNASRNPELRINRIHRQGSLLCRNFNSLWCTALNCSLCDEPIDYFAMLHSDMGVELGWLDTLIDELEANELDVIGVSAPIKDPRGLTSIALDSGDPWHPLARLSMQEIYRLPITFTAEDTGHPVLMNTGCWVAKFNYEWAKEIHFEIRDRKVFDEDRQLWIAEVRPEDWEFSRRCNDLGLRIGVTRKVACAHRGETDFVNSHPWGSEAFDSEYASNSPIPEKPPTDYREIQGYFDWEHLYKEFAERLPEGGAFCEIGCWRGQSLAYLMHELSQLGKKVELWGVDHFQGSVEDPNLRQVASREDVFSQCQENLRSIGYPVKLMRAPSVEGATQFEDASLDGIFIDGSHDRDSVSADLKAWMPKLKPNGILAGHDINQSGVKQALEEAGISVDVLPRPQEMGGVRWGVCWKAR